MKPKYMPPDNTLKLLGARSICLNELQALGRGSKAYMVALALHKVKTFLCCLVSISSLSFYPSSPATAGTPECEPQVLELLYLLQHLTLDQHWCGVLAVEEHCL